MTLRQENWIASDWKHFGDTALIDFKLDPKNGVPFYRQIIDQIRFGMASGQLETGEKLPTVRGLAVELQVNLNTVAKAYKELEIQNILVTHQGTGTFIGSSVTTISADERDKKLEDICHEFLTTAKTYGFKKEELFRQLEQIEI